MSEMVSGPTSLSLTLAPDLAKLQPSVDAPGEDHVLVSHWHNSEMQIDSSSRRGGRGLLAEEESGTALVQRGFPVAGGTAEGPPPRKDVPFPFVFSLVRLSSSLSFFFFGELGAQEYG